MALIAATRISKRYGDLFAIRDLSIQVAEGDRLAVTGPNGSGKSTLLKLLSGSIEPTEGEIEHDRSVCCYVGLESALWPESTVREHLALAASFSNGSRWEDACALLDLQAHINQKVSELSTGFKHRVRLAMAFASAPRVLLLDEPTAALDVAGRAAVARIFEAVPGSAAIVFATNNADDLEWATSEVDLA